MSEFEKWLNSVPSAEWESPIEYATAWCERRKGWNAALEAAANACDRVLYEEGEHNNNICKAKVLALKEAE